MTVVITVRLHHKQTNKPDGISDTNPYIAAQPTETASPTEDNEESDPTTTAEESPTETSEDDATTTDDARTTDGPKTTNLNTGGQTKTDSETGTKTGGKTSATKQKTYDPMDGVGSVVMLTPAVTAGSQLYKIEAPTPITWVWNYTMVQETPSAIDVLVSCSTASATWTLTQNMTFEPTATFTWDTAKYQSEHVDKKLLTEQYTLIIYEADTAPTDRADPGYLTPFDGFRFGLYAKQPYHNLSDWDCVTCSAGNGDLDRQALGFAVSMSVITVLSFTWYVVGIAGLF